MFRSVLAVLLVTVLMLMPIPVMGRPLDSVQSIQYQGKAFCTVFSINEAEGYWASAGHCAISVFEKQLNGVVTIMGMPAEVEVIDLVMDQAIFYSNAKAPALKMATKGVKVGDNVTIRGFPYGLPKIVTTFGHAAARLVPIIHPSYGVVMPSDILDITIAGGNSGSPVLNADGDVVGILWGGFTKSPHALAVPLESLQRLAVYWEE